MTRRFVRFRREPDEDDGDSGQMVVPLGREVCPGCEWRNGSRVDSACLWQL